MTLQQIKSVLAARKILVAVVFFGTILLVLSVSLVLPKKYTAKASVVLDVKSPDPISGMVLQAMMTPTYMATQVDILQSDRVALRAIRSLKLNDNPALKAQWDEQTEGRGSFEAWLVEVLTKELKVSPSRESNVIEVEYMATDPNFSAAMTNAFVRAYIDTTVELRVEPAKNFLELFETQAAVQRKNLEAAQSRLSGYQKLNGIIATDERIDVESQRLQELTTQLVSLQAVSAESRSKTNQLSGNLPEVLGNPLIVSLKSDLARQEAHTKELNARLGTSHPQVLEAQANIAELKSRIDSETARVNASMSVSTSVNVSRENILKAEIDSQKQRLIKLKEQRDQSMVLLRDVESAQRAYETINARLSQTSLESQSNQTNVSVLRAATPPADPSRPRVILNTVLATILGAILASAAALIIEQTDHRLRTLDDLSEAVPLPLIGVMPAVIPKAVLADTKSYARITSPRKAPKVVPQLTNKKA